MSAVVVFLVVQLVVEIAKPRGGELYISCLVGLICGGKSALVGV